MIGIEKFLDKLPISPEESCSYFIDRDSRLRYAIVSQDKISNFTIQVLTNFGYRRSGSIFYNTVCKKCRMCIPYRIHLHSIELNQSQKRNLKHNENLKFIVKEIDPNLEKESLYIRYINAQHPEKNMPNKDDLELLDTMYSQMYSNPSSSLEIEIYDNGKLIGFGILDIGHDLVSAVYNVYDPEYKKHGLGVYMILQSMLWAKNQGFEYFHLGLYIPGHPKMDYKKNYRKGEILHPITKKWEPISSILQ